MNYLYATEDQKKQRREEMVSMRNQGLTIQTIGDKYGVSRERVRQIIGNTGIHFRVEWTKRVAERTDITSLTRDEVVSLWGVKNTWIALVGKRRHKSLTEGYKEEGMASVLLAQNGINNELMPLKCSYDILTQDNKRIDVKHSLHNIQSAPSQKYISPVYRMAHTKRGKDCDFFFCFVPDKEEMSGYAVFIIPAGEVTTPDIRIPWPRCGKKPSKWHQYLNRYDLLQ